MAQFIAILTHAFCTDWVEIGEALAAEGDAWYAPNYTAAKGSKGSSGTECAKFASAFRDDLFGDLPMREFTGHPEEVRPGDLLQYEGHWPIAVTSAFVGPYGDLRTWTVDSGGSGHIAWSTVPSAIGGDELIGIYAIPPVRYRRKNRPAEKPMSLS